MGAFTDKSMKRYSPPGWNPLSHVDALVSLRRYYSLKALCDADENKLIKAGKKYGVDNLSTDYETIIRRIRPDVVSIATRTDIRNEIMAFAIKLGVKGIHGEKPFAQSIKEAKKMIGLFKKHHIQFTFGTYRRYHGIYRAAKKMLQSGEIGNIVQINVEHGRSTLMWTHPHSIDLCLYFSDCEEIATVQGNCIISKFDKANNTIIDDPVVLGGMIRFSNGIIGVIGTGGGMNTRIHGEKGILTISANGSKIVIEKKGKGGSPYFTKTKTIQSTKPMKSGTQNALLELYSAVTRNFETHYDSIVQNQKILMALAYSSLMGGRIIDCRAVPEDFRILGKFGNLPA